MAIDTILIEKTAIEKFSFLTKEGFSEPCIRHESYGIFISYSARDIGIMLQLDWREGPFVSVHKLPSQLFPKGYDKNQIYLGTCLAKLGVDRTKDKSTHSKKKESILNWGDADWKEFLHSSKEILEGNISAINKCVG